MKVDIEDVLFWMDAIRNSEDRYRTLESFWKGQVHSKTWLASEAFNVVQRPCSNIVIHGGWNGVLASILFNSPTCPKHITSVDIDPTCEEIANTVNKRYQIEGRFNAVTCDMLNFKYTEVPDIVINTSCEHVTQAHYTAWLANVPDTALVIVQSNNYFNCDEHVNCFASINEFVEKSGITPLYQGTLPHPLYDRYMIIGKKKTTTC